MAVVMLRTANIALQPFSHLSFILISHELCLFLELTEHYNSKIAR